MADERIFACHRHPRPDHGFPRPKLYDAAIVFRRDGIVLTRDARRGSIAELRGFDVREDHSSRRNRVDFAAPHERDPRSHPAREAGFGDGDARHRHHVRSGCRADSFRLDPRRRLVARPLFRHPPDFPRRPRILRLHPPKRHRANIPEGGFPLVSPLRSRLRRHRLRSVERGRRRRPRKPGGIHSARRRGRRARASSCGGSSRSGSRCSSFGRSGTACSRSRSSR